MQEKNQTRVQQLINALLIVAVVALLGYLSVRFKTELDWTAGKRNTLTEASIKQLKSMPDELVFHVFAPNGADARRGATADLDKYQRVKKNIRIDFIDPSASPQKVRDYQVSYVGQIVAEYQGRRETLNATTEPAITTALQRLAYAGEQTVVFLEGHGERAIAPGGGQDAVDKFAQLLRDKGLKVESLNLVKTPKIPDNTSVLVLASPSRAPLEGEVNLIKDYVARGGNLLWLADPDFPAGLQALADELGVHWQDGYAIFPDYQILGTGHPGFFAAIDYPANAVTQGLDMVTLFPLVRALRTEAKNGFTAQPLLQTQDSAWLETGDIQSGAVGYDEGKDIKGPLTIGATLTRDYKPSAEDKTGKPHPQRIALIGDADFISDAYLQQLGNQQLGLNLVQWLASRDAQLNINVPKAPDTQLVLPGWASLLIAAGFVVLLPLGLLGYGVTRWALRRRR
ncbi:ABC-type uncharacterized transport system involved in gliding motility, auxiliary component [Solimonas aquatica]|uniref:ABC-type uncharacterized transport system involved in gliding motility, auxiliary component n=1 Tax=Solimonas aquatica TaxID=489703 RepID=A0A1H9EMY8_9GAMM|nr:DUF4350 domain-containing protein [Solimonas aquatica]SEQ26947.1 ABC-type uncharacterized transport system involved in gliding motility, auxiliary component [Solimonas aquatica]